MSDSSFDFECVNSDEEGLDDKEHDIVPQDISFKLKYRTSAGKTYQAFEYLLRKDKKLPVSSNLKGLF